MCNFGKCGVLPESTQELPRNKFTVPHGAAVPHWERSPALFALGGS